MSGKKFVVFGILAVLAAFQAMGNPVLRGGGKEEAARPSLTELQAILAEVESRRGAPTAPKELAGIRDYMEQRLNSPEDAELLATVLDDFDKLNEPELKEALGYYRAYGKQLDSLDHQHFVSVLDLMEKINRKALETPATVGSRRHIQYLPVLGTGKEVGPNANNKLKPATIEHPEDKLKPATIENPNNKLKPATLPDPKLPEWAYPATDPKLPEWAYSGPDTDDKLKPATDPKLPEWAYPATDPKLPEWAYPATDPKLPEWAYPATDPKLPEWAYPATDPKLPEWAYSGSEANDNLKPATLPDPRLPVPAYPDANDKLKPATDPKLPEWAYSGSETNDELKPATDPKLPYWAYSGPAANLRRLVEDVGVAYLWCYNSNTNAAVPCRFPKYEWA